MTAAESFLLSVLANAAWQITAVALVAWACAAAATRASAAARHVVWLLALAAAVVLPCWSAYSTTVRARTRVVVLERAAPEASSGVALASAAPAASAARSFAHARIPVSAGAGRALVWAYLIALALRMAGLLGSWTRARALRAEAQAVVPTPSSGRVVEECRRAMGLRSVSILVSPRLETPATVGALRPAILLPRGASDLSPHLMRAVLGHEMAHVRRRDFALNLLCEILAVPFFFHPALAAIRHRLRRLREEACDALVTASVMDARSYAGALVHLAQSLRAAARPLPALGLFDGHSLEDRVMKVLHAAPSRPALSRAMVGGAAAILALASGFASAAAVSVVEREGAAPAARERAGTEASDATREDGPRPGEYTYAAGAKRDPFLDLRVQETRIVDVHDPRAFLVQEIALRGVVKAARGWTAMIMGPDRRTYFVSAGQRFYDGTLVAVDAAGLTFQQQLRDPLAPPRSRELRLALHPETNQPGSN